MWTIIYIVIGIYCVTGCVIAGISLVEDYRQNRQIVVLDVLVAIGIFFVGFLLVGDAIRGAEWWRKFLRIPLWSQRNGKKESTR